MLEMGAHGVSRGVAAAERAAELKSAQRLSN
jgi:hypothetical protein